MECDTIEKGRQLIGSFYEQLGTESQNPNIPPASELVEDLKWAEAEYINGDIAGIAGLKRGDNRLFLIVKSQYRNKGLGQELIRKVIQRARKNKLGYIALTVFKDNEGAMHIYSKHGFYEVSSMKLNNRDAYYMIKPLLRRYFLYPVLRRLEFILMRMILRFREGDCG